VAAFTDSVRVGDLNGVGVGEECPAGIPLTGQDGLIPNPGILAQVTASENCFSFVETIPGGFVPRFGGENRDFSIAAGLRGQIDFGTGLNYDVKTSSSVTQSMPLLDQTHRVTLSRVDKSKLKQQ